MNSKDWIKQAKAFGDQMAHLSPEEAKQVFMTAAKLAEEVMAKKNPSPNFSSWPPEMPERECAWRKDDELQKYRLRVPEPTTFDHGDRVRYRMDVECNFAAYFSVQPEIVDFKDGEFQKILVRENGGAYYAWSADGKTPIFPIPL